MKTRWTWLGGARVEAIEVVQDGDGIEVNVLPAAETAPSVWAVETTRESATAPTVAVETLPALEAVTVLEEASAPDTGAAPSGARGDYSAAQRVGMGTIRGMWVQVFGIAGTGITYAADNVAGLGLPTWGVFAIGLAAAGVGYGVKRGVFPDGTF